MKDGARGGLTRRALVVGAPVAMGGWVEATAVGARAAAVGAAGARASATALAGGSLLAASAQAGPAEVEALLRRGGVVIAFRHARAPGTFDPPGMRLDDCRTQRNLDDDGRAQARRIGRWFSDRGLKPARVRSSPWCRCVDTATLAFGAPQVWAALSSPVGQGESTTRESVAALRQALAAAVRQPGRFEAWVTHMFVLSALTGEPSDSGEGLVLGSAADGSPRVLARLMA